MAKGDATTAEMRGDTSDSLLARVAATESFAPAALPERFGRYRVVRTLGRGGLGLVLLAHDELLGREVALKLVRPDRRVHASGRQLTARLRREAQALARVVHPAVVAVLDIGETDDLVYIVMERLHGVTARRWIKEGRSWRAIVAMYEAAARGLVEAHRLGIVHRDVKPDNIMVEPDGRVVLVDFGLASAARERDEIATPASGPHEIGLTEVGVVLGTRGYAAPELLAGAPASPASDQYALCVSLAEALAGERLPRRISAAITRGLDRDPARRHRSIAALLDALHGELRVPGGALLVGAALATGAVAFAIRDDDAASAPAEIATDAGVTSDDERTRARIAEVAELRDGFDRSQFEQVRRRLPTLVAELRAADDHRALAHALALAGEIDVLFDAIDTAQATLDEAFGLATATGEDAAAFVAALQLAAVHRRLGDTADGRLWLERARSLLARAPDPRNEARLEFALARTPDSDVTGLEARAHYERALALLAPFGDAARLDIAALHGNFAADAFDAGRFDEARREAELAIAGREGPGSDHDPELGMLLLLAGVSQWRTGDDQAAETSLRRALTLLGATLGRDNQRYGFAALALAEFLVHAHRGGEAHVHLAVAREVLGRAQDDMMRAYRDSILAELYVASGDDDTALALAESALAAEETIRIADDPVLVSMRLLLGTIWQRKGELDRARSYLAAARAGVTGEAGERHHAAIALAQARVELDRHRFADAARLAREAIDTIEARGGTEDTNRARFVLAVADHQRGAGRRDAAADAARRWTELVEADAIGPTDGDLVRWAARLGLTDR